MTIPPPPPPPPPPVYVVPGANYNDDEEYARQIQSQIENEEIEQSKRDEEYARTIALSLSSSSGNGNGNGNGNGSTPRRRSKSKSSKSRRSLASLSSSSRSIGGGTTTPRKSSSRRSLSSRKSLLLLSSPNIVDLPPSIPIPPLAKADADAYLTIDDDRDRSSNESGSTAPSTDIDISTSSDEIVARRIQQEMQDADFAQRMSLREQQEIASNDVVQSIERQQELAAAGIEHQQQQQQRPPKSCLAKFLPLAFCIAIAITVPLLFVFNVFSTDNIPFFGDLFGDDFIGNDPWSGKVNNVTIIEINGTSVPQVPTNAYRWQNDGNGLRLDILNACSDEDGERGYSSFVQTAIANWDSGSPIDSLTLFSSKVPYEKECSTITGKLKICNG